MNAAGSVRYPITGNPNVHGKWSHDPQAGDHMGVPKKFFITKSFRRSPN